jgi:hypothetical protein
MSKFNQKLSVRERIVERPDVTSNKEGSIAFKSDAKTELFNRVATWLVGEPKFYGSVDDETGALIHAVMKDDPEFILKLALFARSELYLRSAPVVLLGEFAKSNYTGTVPGARKYVQAIIQRPDEITELGAYTLNSKQGKLPLMVKNGIKQVFESGKFNTYQIGKYNRKGEVTLRDMLFLTHPKPQSREMATLFKQLADETVPVPETWETYISANGSNTETWTHIAPKMPIFALVRNLRNLLQNNVDPELYVDKMENPEVIARSKMFPYRFYAAYKEVDKAIHDYPDPFKAKRVLKALEKAMELSIGNVPKLKGRTFTAVDLSGSMTFTTASGFSSVTPLEIASVFGSMMQAIAPNSIISAFGERFSLVHGLTGNILSDVRTVANTHVGHSTNAYLSIQYLLDNKISVDRIVIFSDMQCYDSRRWFGGASLQEMLRKYKSAVNPNVTVYSVDLDSYGTLQFPQDEKGVALLAGFSDKLFKFMDIYEKDAGTMVDEIENISI